MSQKAENLLNLALDATSEEREKSLELEVGYQPLDQEWDLIIKYSGNLEAVREIASSVTELSNEYAILTVPESRIEQLTRVPQIEYIAKQGYELMDKKRNILIRELMDLIDEARDIQDEIDSTFTYAYQCLQRANIEHGINMVSQIAYTVPIENSITIQTRSIMGTEIPHVKYTPSVPAPTYAFSTTRESVDLAADAFRKVKDLTVKLSMVENAAYRLATNIKKTQKRANALQNITIPMYTELVYNITNALEEKEREEFTRLKVIKRMKQKKSGG